MELYLTGTSALQVWRSPQMRHLNSGTLFDIPASYIPHVRTSEALALAAEYDIRLPLEVGVAKRANRRNSKLLHCSYSGAANWVHQFMKVREGLFVARPEACLLEMARHIDDVELALCGAELMGAYALVPGEDFEKRYRLATHSSVEQYLERSAGMDGHKKLSAILPYIPENSFSPMESALTLLLTFPISKGGYGLPLPVLNKKVELGVPRDGGETTIIRRPDLLWEQAKLTAEYDSAQWHQLTSYDAHYRESDARRRNIFIYNGFTVVTVTPDQLFSLPYMDDVACLIAQRLGCAPPPTDEGTREVRKAFRDQVFEASGLHSA